MLLSSKRSLLSDMCELVPGKGEKRKILHIQQVSIMYLLAHYTVSVQFSLSVVSSSLQPHELQHARPPCPSPTPGVPLISFRMD